MAKKAREMHRNHPERGNKNDPAAGPFIISKEALDPSLAILFASSAGPVKAPSRVRYENPTQFTSSLPAGDGVKNASENDDQESSNFYESLENGSTISLVENGHYLQTSQDMAASFNQIEAQLSIDDKPRKRKRQIREDDLEGKYMLRLAAEEEKEEEAWKAERQSKRQKLVEEQGLELSGEEQYVDVEDDSHESDGPAAILPRASPLEIPQHESLAPDKDVIEVEKSGRTVFLANVSTLAITDKRAKKTLLEHIGSLLGSLPKQDGKEHKIESIRFRSTAYAGIGLPKKAAFATKSLMEATTKSTNAYVVYSTAFAAREAVKQLNGTMVLERHLRVDGVAHPAKIDHRRCVFVGNLGFVDDESMMDQGGENERKRSKIPSDVEEGLWRQFSKAGTIESVRVVRDEKTRVGKGFAYVQFQDANSVEAALLFHDKKYPPMLPRILRVTRAKAIKKTAQASKYTHPTKRHVQNGPINPNHQHIYNPKLSGQYQSLQGRAAKLLGKAGAARLKSSNNDIDKHSQPRIRHDGIIKTPEKIIFEGYRASQKSGIPKDLKLGRSGVGKKKRKLGTRSSKRASEWKKIGAKKMK